MKNKISFLLIGTFFIIANTSCDVADTVDKFGTGATATSANDNQHELSVPEVVDSFGRGAAATPVNNNQQPTSGFDASANDWAITATPLAEEISPLLPDAIRFEGVTENIKEFPYKIILLNNCAGNGEIEQIVTNTFTHEVVDESKEKLGVEIPILIWLNIVADIEHHYGIKTTEQETISSKLKALAGENVEYTLVHKQTWESGTIITQTNNEAITASYRILKSEIIGIANSEKKSCP